jgi:hypothetical protein
MVGTVQQQWLVAAAVLLHISNLSPNPLAHWVGQLALMALHVSSDLQMQQCGQPPQEIVDELAPGMRVRLATTSITVCRRLLRFHPSLLWVMAGCRRHAPGDADAA